MNRLFNSMVVRVVHVGDGALILFILLPIVDYLDSAPYLMHKGGGGASTRCQEGRVP